MNNDTAEALSHEQELDHQQIRDQQFRTLLRKYNIHLLNKLSDAGLEWLQIDNFLEANVRLFISESNLNNIDL